MQEIPITLPEPLEWQWQVINESRRFNVLAIGRRGGKTHLCINRVATPETLPYPMAWFAPSYRYMTEVWREAEVMLDSIITRRNSAEFRMEFITGGVLEFWSLDNKRAGASRKYRRVIVDEAAFVPDLVDIWNNSIRPTLADYQGDAYFASTPKGRNGFWQLWQRGNDEDEPDWMMWQMPTEVNPYISRQEIADMRASMPERVAAQELDAMFLDDAGGVFRNVVAAATAEPQDSGVHNHTYTIGVDWARENDFTCLAVYDVTLGEIVALDRFNKIDYQVQLGRLTALYERFRPTAVIAEANSIGQPLIEQLQRSGLPVVPFITTNASKQIAVDALTLAFETGTLRIIPDQVLIGELQAYQGERLPGGAMRYSAPSGMHDDTVMAVMLAISGGTAEPVSIRGFNYAQRNISRPSGR